MGTCHQEQVPVNLGSTEKYASELLNLCLFFPMVQNPECHHLRVHSMLIHVIVDLQVSRFKLTLSSIIFKNKPERESNVHDFISLKSIAPNLFDNSSVCRISCCSNAHTYFGKYTVTNFKSLFSVCKEDLFLLQIQPLTHLSIRTGHHKRASCSTTLKFAHGMENCTVAPRVLVKDLKPIKLFGSG